MGKPVALLASAELRDTRGFISMTIIRPVSGWTANWMLLPPVSTPISRMIANDASRITWNSRSVSVWIGATVIESPVWTPIGSTFSMEQMITQLSAWSRITSISNSFHPSSDSSMSTSLTGDMSSPRATMVSNSSRLYAMPPPVPPSVKAGRMMSGIVPISAATARPSSIVCATPEVGISRPIFSIAFLKARRSSPLWIASGFAPIMRTPYFSSTPSSCSFIAQFSAVCPPSVGSSASGFSAMMIFSTTSGVIGSM